MRHAAVLVDTDGDHQIAPIDEDVSSLDHNVMNIQLLIQDISPLK